MAGNFSAALVKMQKNLVKSYYNNDKDILSAIKTLYCHNKAFDLDPCYSKGNFYETNMFVDTQPKIKMDKCPQTKDTIQNDILNGIPLPDNSIENVIFDPPFMFGQHGKTAENIMAKRFSMFDDWEQLKTMYQKALLEFYRILRKGGIVAFKCQDYTDSKTTLTHCYVHNWAIEYKFAVEDIFILIWDKNRIWNSNLIQKHARKFHSYWLVFKK